MLRFALKISLKLQAWGSISQTSRGGITLDLISLWFHSFPGMSQVPWKLWQHARSDKERFVISRSRRERYLLGSPSIGDREYLTNGYKYWWEMEVWNSLENQPVVWDGSMCILEQGHASFWSLNAPLWSLNLAPALTCHTEELLRGMLLQFLVET